MAAAERNSQITEKLTVLSQSHRRTISGDLRDALDQRRESPVGRFVIRNKLAPELYDAALEYGNLVRFHCAVKARAVDIREGNGSGGGEISAEKAKWLAKEVERLDRPLRKLNPVGFSAVRTLAAMEREIAPEAEPATIIVLAELGSLLKKTGRR
jgi:hypothetical protein